MLIFAKKSSYIIYNLTEENIRYYSQQLEHQEGGHSNRNKQCENIALTFYKLTQKPKIISCYLPKNVSIVVVGEENKLYVSLGLLDYLVFSCISTRR